MIKGLRTCYPLEGAFGLLQLIAELIFLSLRNLQSADMTSLEVSLYCGFGFEKKSANVLLSVLAAFFGFAIQVFGKSVLDIPFLLV